MDRSLFLAIVFLIGLGVVQVYSSSFIFAIESMDDGLFFVKKQALFAVAGILVLLATASMPIRWMEKLGYLVFTVSIIGIGLTLIPGLGVKVGGATRWLSLGGGFRLEPSELLKYSMPFFVAFAIQRIKSTNVNHFEFASYFIFGAIPFLVLLKQPDFGSVAILIFVVTLLLFSQGLRWRYVMGGALASLFAFYFLIVRVPYRMARIEAFLDPWADPAAKGFQVIQSMLGYYSGRLKGVGLGQGQGKLFFLPEAHTDFTLSVLGEELGFIGFLIVVALFAFITFRGFQIAMRTKSQKWQIVSLGVTLIFGLAAWINVGVTLGILPTKGLGAPFLSYGGSALLAASFGLGVLLNIDRHNSIERRKTFFTIK